ncbi:[Histone H3]-lysine-36 demethylase [Sporobolomyces koalae]|uniref:[Histone H3]-lysine-36 demethylase n=1 Tax=Sporobolomyces koalae TaxID=500713 RepID=UPI00317246E5
MGAKMTDTATSSPLSEPIELVPPPEVSPSPKESETIATSKPSGSSPTVASGDSMPATATSTSLASPPRKKSASTTRRKRTSTATAGKTALEEPCPTCKHLDAKNRKLRSQAELVWVEYAKLGCPEDSIDSIDKWYCTSCLTTSLSTGDPLTISYKLTSSVPSIAPVASTSSNVRKSARATKSQLDYSNLHMHLPASADRWSHVISARVASGQIKPDRFERKLAQDLTLEWVYGREGMTEPFVVERPEGLGMSMPRRDITVGEIAELIGPQTSLEVIDCASQSSLSNWTLGDWARYYTSPDRDKVRNVISLEVSQTKLGKMVIAPEIVRKLDWVETVWPNDLKIPGQFPQVQKYCLMSVERCWTDWHIDFAGSSVFYHVLKGGKTFYFIRPTAANLAAYERWSGSTERQEQEWLGDSCDEVLKIELKEGNTAFLPTGWIHAVYTPADSIVIGGNFLHSLNIPTQLRIYQIELATKVPKKFRYPHFVKLLWFVADHYHSHLSQLALPATAESPLPPTISPRVLEGLLALSTFLIEQTTRFLKSPLVSVERRRIARENVPWAKVPDPVTLTRELRKNVLRAMGKELDAECFKPHGIEEDEGNLASTGLVPGATLAHAKKSAGIKRKGTEELAPGPRAAKIKHANNTSSPPPPHATSGTLHNPGEIIARQAIPVPMTTRFELRPDPTRPELGVRMAEVRDTRNSQIVTRRWEESGEVFVETRTVHTIIERVRWSRDTIKIELPPPPSVPRYPFSYPAIPPQWPVPTTGTAVQPTETTPQPPTYHFPPLPAPAQTTNYPQPAIPYPAYYPQPPTAAANAAMSQSTPRQPEPTGPSPAQARSTG